MSELLSFVGVYKGFPRGGQRFGVLVGLSVEVDVGEVVAVVSSRGEGKSTLLQVAAGLERPDAGEVWFGGRDLAQCSDRDRSRLLQSEIAWTDREGPGLGWDVRDFVGLSLAVSGRRGRRQAQAAAERALDRVGAGGAARKRWCDLSDWERVLVGFARGIVRGPRLMVVDGLLDRLSMRATQDAGDLLRSLVAELGCGVLLSASDAEAALAADRVWLFESGRLKLLSDQTRGPAQIIDFHYRVGEGEPIRAVDGISMSAATGEFVALYGPSGSGKTTLLDLIAGLSPPDAGSVIVDGRDVLGMSRKESDKYRQRQLGIIGQPNNLIPGARAIENASLKLWLTNKHKAKDTIEPLLDRLGLGERMRHRTEQLSMGERQRVLIAMALATDPKLVLADEPTGALDTQRTLEVLALLRELCVERGATIVLATHDPQAAAFADQVHELRDGHLGEYRPDQVLAPGSVLASGK
ncbi:MAG: ATP-binding cassette domain-containing protein [Solirubrobacteraceae bacterium]